MKLKIEVVDAGINYETTVEAEGTYVEIMDALAHAVPDIINRLPGSQDVNWMIFNYAVEQVKKERGV